MNDIKSRHTWCGYFFNVTTSILDTEPLVESRITVRSEVRDPEYLLLNARRTLLYTVYGRYSTSVNKSATENQCCGSCNHLDESAQDLDPTRNVEGDQDPCIKTSNLV